MHQKNLAIIATLLPETAKIPATNHIDNVDKILKVYNKIGISQFISIKRGSILLYQSPK